MECVINNFEEMNKPQKSNERLGKKMAYLLRYGAEKEGLAISQDGKISDHITLYDYRNFNSKIYFFVIKVLSIWMS